MVSICSGSNKKAIRSIPRRSFEINKTYSFLRFCVHGLVRDPICYALYSRKGGTSIREDIMELIHAVVYAGLTPQLQL